LKRSGVLDTNVEVCQLSSSHIGEPGSLKGWDFPNTFCVVLCTVFVLLVRNHTTNYRFMTMVTRINVTITILDMIHRPAFYLKDVSETEF
jgi:hypothetical protein